MSAKEALGLLVQVWSNCDFKLRTCSLIVNCGGADDDEASSEALEDNAVVVPTAEASRKWRNADAAVADGGCGGGGGGWNAQQLDESSSKTRRWNCCKDFIIAIIAINWTEQQLGSHLNDTVVLKVKQQVATPWH